MFSFHKPKIYRSHLGCCICKAKSSSSRFTDSNKYENEFEQCFRIQEKRSGEICNACVLLVKRWKKLSPESRSNKHWHHVVDARAGPGTGKLTGNKRLTIGSSSASSSSSSSGNSNQLVGSECSSSSNNRQQQQLHQNRKSDILPLSSSSQANSSGSTSGNNYKTRISNKARAIDTNVSHFTFGEPYYNRRNHMLGEQTSSNCYTSSTSSNLSALTKPHSALNSSAFESVIKRFRQRQQQQQLDAKRRELNRQQRQQQRLARGSDANATTARQQSDIHPREQQPAADNSVKLLNEQQQQQQQQQATFGDDGGPAPIKRLKRSSIEGTSATSAAASTSSSASPSLSSGDMLRISSLLDGSVWRKEKICCGYIFRGPYDELAIFPKLLKPCKCRDSTSQVKDDDEDEEEEEEEVEEEEEEDEVEEDEVELIKDGQQPPPRAAKSGSISSCDSNTSGTGSMEQPLDEIQSIKRAISLTADQRKSNSCLQKTGKSMAVGKQQQQRPVVAGRNKRRLLQLNNDNDTSSSSSSSSRLMILNTDEDEEEVEGLILDDDEACESSNDASASSIESLTDKEPLEQVATS